MTIANPVNRRDASIPTASAIVTGFLTAFFSGALDRARSMVRDDFSFRAPLIETTASKDVYFAGSDRKVRFVRDLRIVRQWEDANEVSTVYEIDVETPAGRASMLMHEWHTIRDNQLTSTVMIFDTEARAAQLLREALALSH
jgi:ketosteroid isomerase-like protein